MGSNLGNKTTGSKRDIGWTIQFIYQYAGIVGVNPDNFTLGELTTMANAKQKHNWDLIAPLICGIYNQFASKRTRINIADVHPFLKKTQKVIPFNSVMWDELLKQLRK